MSLSSLSPNHPGITPLPLPVTPRPPKPPIHTINPLLAVLMAEEKASQVGSEQELTDAKTTELNVGIQERINQSWESTIDADVKQVQKDAQNIGRNPKDQKYQAQLNADQAQLNEDQSSQQTANNQANSQTQQLQTQVGTDATNLQQLLQSAGSLLNQVEGQLSSAIASLG